jgi:UDP-N-acetylglucosamine acyltransferase
MIHPTAIIHPKAQIGPDCEIGPYCVIGEHVVLGPRCSLLSHVTIDGHTTLGAENEIYPFASLGHRSQDLKWKGGTTYLDIGDKNTIRECVTIHCATGDGERTIIGSNNAILAGSHVGHNAVLGNRIIVSMSGLAGHVTIEDFAVVGGHSAVHQFCRIGTMSMIGGCSRIAQDVPPYMMVEGNPSATRTVNKIGLERNGVSEEAQSALKKAFKILFRSGLTVPNALIQLERDVPPLPEIQHLVGFVKSSERGLVR